MQEKSLSTFGDGTNASFSNRILMMRVNAAVLYFLIVFSDMRHEFICLKSAIVSMVGSDNDSMIKS